MCLECKEWIKLTQDRDTFNEPCVQIKSQELFCKLNIC
jgi:hypothetical protein